MTAPAPEVAPTAEAGTTVERGTTVEGASTVGGRRRRRWLWPAVVGVLVLLACLVGAALVPTGTLATLDPASTAAGGSRAVAQVLQAQGVDVDTVDRAAAAVDGATGDTTIVVVHSALLGPDQLGRLAGTPAALVLVEPDLTAARALAPGVTPSAAGAPDDAQPGCTDPDAVAAGTATGGGTLYRVGTPGADAAVETVGCYPAADDPALHAVVRLRTATHRVTVLGQPRVLENQALAHEGNAALALRVLGAGTQVRWYLPTPAELGQQDGPGVGALLPGWVRPLFWQLVVAVAVVLLWRARRLGKVVTEPLPVVVRSAETAQGRARLYRASRSRDRAAAILRTAALRRLAARLGVPSGAAPDEVALLVAAAGGRRPDEVREQLLGATPTDDAALVRLAGALDDVERSITDRAGGYGGARTDGAHAGGTRSGGPGTGTGAGGGTGATRTEEDGR